MAEEPPPAAIARQRAIGNAAVHDQQRRPGPLRLAVEVGPDFGLEHDHNGGTQPPQHSPDDAAVVDRREENALRQFGQSLLGCRASGQGRGGDINRRLRPLGSQAAKDLHSGEHFPNRDGMKPNGAGCRRVEGRRQEAQTLSQAGEIPAVPDSPVK